METITLPDVTIKSKPNGVIEIIHNKSKTRHVTTAKRLTTWAISQLRKELSPTETK